jgi:PPP family 3-phenylpropionic acid transporter
MRATKWWLSLSSVLHPSFAWRLAVFYAALFVALGVQVPFLPLWLAAKGLDATLIGIVLSLPMIVRVFAIPLATRGADRHDALHTVIVIASGMAVLGYGALGLAHGVVAITLAYALASAFFTPLIPLADAYALRAEPHRTRLRTSAAVVLCRLHCRHFRRRPAARRHRRA